MTNETTYCEIHPDRETGLRCNKCERLMCAECAVQTPIGYRCRECVRQVEDKFFKGTDADYLIVAGTALIAAIVGGFITGVLNNFLLFAFFLGILVGGVISEGVLRVVDHRRGRYSGEVVAGAIAAGSFLGGALHAYFTYPDEARQIHQIAREAGQQISPAMLDVFPTLSTYITENTLSIGLIVFAIVTAMTAYSRVKM